MLFDTAFDDEITVIEVRGELADGPEPPALPFPLVARKEAPSEDLEIITDEISFSLLDSGFFG